MKIKFIVFSVMILMYQNNVVYSSSEDSYTNYSSNDDIDIPDEVIANINNEKDVKKRINYLEELDELKKAVEESNFSNKDKLNLLSIIEWSEKLCIQWDQINSDIDHIEVAIETINDVVLQKIKNSTKSRNNKQYRTADAIMKFCNKLKEDFGKLLGKKKISRTY